jgi:polar amino acid transport system ATP-binding protein
VTAIADPNKGQPGVIAFRGVNKWFGALHVLKDITINVEPREVVVVCGPSGSGKSTLIRCINGLEAIRDGDLVVDGQHVGDAATNMTLLRTEIGFVFQLSMCERRPAPRRRKPDGSC